MAELFRLVTIRDEVYGDDINNGSRPPDDGLKFLLAMRTESPRAAPESCAQLSRDNILSTDAWLEKLKQVASQDKYCSKVASDVDVDSMFSSLKDRGGYERVVTAAKGAAFLAHKSLSHICWTTHAEKVFSKDPDALYRVQWEVLKALTKLALSVCDLEDFIRIAYREEMHAERLKFIKDMFSSCKTADETIMAIVRGEMNQMMDDCDLLCECDINSILEQWRILPNSAQRIPKICMAETYGWMSEDARVYDVLTDCTILLMKQYPPLKRHCVSHLMMELARGKCCCIRDTLLLECLGLFNFEHLNGLVPHVPFVELDNLASEIFEAMTELIEWKVLELGKSMKSATFPLRSGVIGTFTEEVIEVVEHADCERRLEGHRFISTHHLLLGLLRTRIRKSALIFVQFGHGRKEPSSYPASSIYAVAYQVARLSGNEKIDLEHLFSAIMIINLATDELLKDIIAIILDNHLSMPTTVRILGILLMGINIDTYTANLEGEGIPSNSLAYRENTWNAELSSKSVDEFFEGVNKYIRREKGYPMYVVRIRGRTVEGSIWDFGRWVSLSWESTCNLLPILRANGRKPGWEEGED